MVLARREAEARRRVAIFVDKLDGLLLYRRGTTFYDLLEAPPRNNFFLTANSGSGTVQDIPSEL